MLVFSFRSTPDGFGISNATGFLGFQIGTDPSNPGKYRIYYEINLTYISNTSPNATLRFSEQPAFGGYTAITSGTITIGGITFTWYSHYIGTSHSGGSMSATSSSFTY